MNAFHFGTAAFAVLSLLLSHSYLRHLTYMPVEVVVFTHSGGRRGYLSRLGRTF